MKPQVILTSEEIGMVKGREEGLKALVDTLKKYSGDFQSLYEGVVANEAYASLH